MAIGEFCKREVVTIRPDATVADAAKLMRKSHVGALVVVKENGSRKPVGILTDRDIVVSVVAADLDENTITAGDIAGKNKKLILAKESDGVFETIQRMQRGGVRRIPVTDEQGGLRGIVSLSDLLQLLSAEISGLTRVVSREQLHEWRTRKVL